MSTLIYCVLRVYKLLYITLNVLSNNQLPICSRSRRSYINVLSFVISFSFIQGALFTGCGPMDVSHGYALLYTVMHIFGK